jgi:hypothetical protein
MPPHDETSTLQIRCPSCGQRFKVGSDLRDRVVECGACEHRFKIDDDSVLRSRKFYPGERRDPSLDSFARVPHAPSVLPDISTVQYAAEPSRESFEPPTPLRTLAGFAAVCGMLVAAALLGFGGGAGGILDGVAFPAKLGIAIFAGVLGGILLIYANPRGRKKAVLVSLLFFAGLVTIPVINQEGFRATAEPSNPSIEKRVVEEPQVDPDAELAAQIRLEPLFEESARLAAAGEGKRAVAVWFRGMKDSNKYLVRDYVIKATGASPANSHIYPRGTEASLMILSGSPESNAQIADAVRKLGSHAEATIIHEKLNVIEVNVDNSRFLTGSSEKLNNKNDPAFYDLNRHELESIDPERILKAVTRLADAEPKVYRDDIGQLLVEQVKIANTALLPVLCRALKIWTSPDDQAAITAVTAAVEKLHDEEKTIPKDSIDFLVSRKVISIAPILDELWNVDPTTWETLYGDLGPVIEPLLIKRLPELKGYMRRSAVKLLGRVGGEKSFKEISKITDADPELSVIVERAIKDIKERQ